jgi:hypothetical protein
MSVSLLPGIISDAMVSVNSVIAVCRSVTVAPRSVAIVAMATLRLVAAKLAMNWARASGRTMDRPGTTFAAVAPALVMNRMLSVCPAGWITRLGGGRLVAARASWSA